MEILGVKRRAWAQININNLEYNFKQVKCHTSSKICCVIKANAYGHGAVRLAKLYQDLQADYLAVSNIEEALQLRYNHIHLPILILGYTPYECVSLLSKNNITQCVFSYKYGLNLNKAAKRAGVVVKAHIKLDSGMGRIGFICTEDKAEILKAVEVCKMANLDFEGIFTHFAVADEGECGEEYTREQFKKFIEAIKIFENNNIYFKIKHCANSACVFDYPEYHLDMIRAGIVLYGLKPSRFVKGISGLKPAMSLHSVISNVKSVKKAQSIGYGRTYIALDNRIIATIPIGYADGFRRFNGEGRGCVLVKGKPAPIIGRICMDQLMVDITGIDCKVGDEVLMFGGTDFVSVDNIALCNDTINYEVVCNVGERVPRVYIKNNKIVAWKDEILSQG